jgi:hypothetical protein
LFSGVAAVATLRSTVVRVASFLKDIAWICFVKSGKKGQQVSGCCPRTKWFGINAREASAQMPSFIPRSIWCPGKRTAAFRLLSFFPFSFTKFFFT